MSKWWLFGTVVPLAVWAYVAVGRAAYGFACKRWPTRDWQDGEFPKEFFSIFWLVTVPVWALVRFVITPAWRAVAFAERWGEKLTEKEPHDE